MRFHNSEMCHFENESHADRNGSPVQTPFQPALDEKFEDQKSLCRMRMPPCHFSPPMFEGIFKMQEDECAHRRQSASTIPSCRLGESSWT